jgi:hypothetical protein
LYPPDERFGGRGGGARRRLISSRHITASGVSSVERNRAASLVSGPSGVSGFVFVEPPLADAALARGARGATRRSE